MKLREKMSRNTIEDLLDRYLEGKTSTEENERVEQWLENNGNPDSAWQQFNAADKAQWLTNIFDDIQQHKHIPEKTKIVSLPTRKSTWRSIAAVAAMLIVASAISLNWPAIQNRLHPQILTALTVPANQKKQLILPDGSVVWINSDSELKYPKEFKGKVREVYLSGEAYFDIHHDTSKPFLIHTGKLLTTVLGTAFNIKEDKAQHTITVTVTRGKVGVADGNKQLGIITPNQQISFNLLNERSVQKEVDAQQVIAWQDNELRFDDITFDAAAAQLVSRFGVRISFSNNNLKKCQFSGAALTGEKLDKILKVICSFNKATYQIKTDGSILIEGKGCTD